MDKSWIRKGVRKLSNEHIKGVEGFMLQFVRTKFAKDDAIFCPCCQCNNRNEHTQGRVEDHLLIYGMTSTYDRWIHHGEAAQEEPQHAEAEAEPHHGGDEGIDFMENVLQEHAGLEEEDGFEDDRIPDLLKDLYNSEDHVDGQRSMFAEVLEEAKRAAVEGGKFSRFTFTVKLLHVKSFYRISNAAFNAILRLLTLQFPDSSVPKDYEDALRVIRKLGLGYVSIHVCPNNCVLYRKAYKKYDNCPKCNASRWKDADGKKSIPEKVLRHFPLKPRLQRMFLSEKSSEK